VTRTLLKMLIVIAGLFGLLQVAQRATTRIASPSVRFSLTATEEHPRGSTVQWTFSVDKGGMMTLNGLPVRDLETLASKIRDSRVPLTLEAHRVRLPYETDIGEADPLDWTFRVASDGTMTLDGRPATVADVVARIEPLVIQGVTRPVMVKDVLAKAEPLEMALPRSQLKSYSSSGMPGLRPRLSDVGPGDDLIRMPTRSKVSFPGRMTYKEAFPEDDDEPEFVIKEFHESPFLRDRAAQDAANAYVIAHGRKYYYLPEPDSLPPVEQRLPQNPAVVTGPDTAQYGREKYGRIWYRATESTWDFSRKLAMVSFVKTDPKGDIQPDLAYKWDIEDNRVYTFYMRKGHKWSDGHPFTVQDILWVANTVIGSPYWPDRSMWMAPTDGSASLYVDDILNWQGLAATIVDQGRSDAPSPGRQVWSLADETLRQMLTEVAAGKAPDEERRYALVNALGQIFRRPGFYDEAAWQGVDLESDLRDLESRIDRLDKEELWQLQTLRVRNDWLQRSRVPRTDPRYEDLKLNDSEVFRLNLHLFRAAFRGLVRPAIRTSVKIEAVPDENGDDTHIIRFTFNKPNSFFLIEATHFMFYRGLFSMPRHTTCVLHPDGTDRLSEVDIRRWKTFVTTLKRQALAEGDNPGKRIWSALSADVRSGIDEALSSGRLRDDMKASELPTEARDFVADLNRILASRDFYCADVWTRPDGKPVDLQREMTALFTDSDGNRRYISREREFKSSEVTRYNYLMIRRRLLERGADALSDADVYRLNQMMFRAAYDGDGLFEENDDTVLVARDRTDALDKEARRIGWKGWVDRFRKLGGYLPPDNKEEPNFNMPVLNAWRLVGEEGDAVARAVRNPYYFKVDSDGNQLPYIDMIVTEKAGDRNTRQGKMRAGKIGFQSRDVEFKDFTYLKQFEKSGNYRVLLWANDYVGELTFYTQEDNANPVLRKLFGDWRFHHALSYALNRQQMIDVVWRGMGTPAQWSVPEGSKYYVKELAEAAVEYDPEKANRLLDEVFEDLGWGRKSPDGKRMYLDESGKWQVLTIDVNTDEARELAAVEMAVHYWQQVGLNVQMQIRAASYITNLGNIGKNEIGVHIEGGNFFGPLLAGGMAPTHSAECSQWPSWARWIRSGGIDGEEPPDRIKQLEVIWTKVIEAPNERAQLEAWRELCLHAAHRLSNLGIMTSPGKVVYVHNSFRNVPKMALAGWGAHEPSNCCPEAFYIVPGDH
jgi:ABC-type transport system substrate-binding protein